VIVRRPDRKRLIWKLYADKTSREMDCRSGGGPAAELQGGQIFAAAIDRRYSKNRCKLNSLPTPS
jgi:hypothetical protein